MPLLDLLCEFENQLPELLQDPKLWKRCEFNGVGGFNLLRYACSKEIDGNTVVFNVHKSVHNENPTVELPRPHSHSLPIIVHILGGGTYEQGITYQAVSDSPKEWSRVISAGEWWYELHARNVHHYVRVLDEPVYAVCGVSRINRPQNNPLLISPRPRPDLLPLVKSFFDARA